MLQKQTVLFLLVLLVALCKGQLNLDYFDDRVQQQIEASLKPLENLGVKVSHRVRQELRELDGLGERIQQQVYKDLEPVRIMQSMMNVRFGIDGTTVATFAPSGRQVIIKNGVYFECNGQIDVEKVECVGTLAELQFQKDEDFCFVTSRSTINEWYCLVPNGNARTISYINGRIICEASDNSPRLLIERKKFDEMCKNVATRVTYKYTTTFPLHDIGNQMTCSGRQPQVCSFSEPLNNSVSTTIINRS